MPNGRGFIERMGLQAILELKEFRTGVAQYKQLVREVDQVTAESAKKSEAAAADMGDAWQDYWKKTDKASLGAAKAVKEGADDAASAAKEMEKSLTRMAKKAAAAIGIFVALRKSMQFMKDATLLAANVEMLGIALETVGKNAGYTAAQTREFEEAVKAQGITTQKARQSLLFMGQAEIDFAHAADLARIAQDAGRIANINSSEAMQRLTWVISTGSTLMARRLGLQVNFEASYKRMAAEVGRSTEELTGQERAQARVFEVMRAGEAISGVYEASLTTAGGLMLSLARHTEEVARVIGEVNLKGFAVGIDEITRLLKELREWMEENKDELEDLSDAVGALVGALRDIADLELPTEDLTEFVDQLTTMTAMLALGIETVKGFRKENTLLATSLDRTLKVMSALNKFAAWPITVIDLTIDKFTELRKEQEDFFKTEAQLREEYLLRYKDDNKRWWETVRDRWDGIREEEAAAEAARLAALEEMREKAAEKLSEYLDRVADLERDHQQKLEQLAADAVRRRVRDFNKFQSAFRKQYRKGLKALEKITAAYEKKRAKTIADFEKRIAKVREKIGKSREKAQVDWELREKQARERFDLSMLQSERRYQFERAWLVAEGDTLAIERLDALYKLQQEEDKENEALRRKHADENRRKESRQADEDARERIAELRDQLADVLKEMAEAYRERMKEQEQANIDRLVEMTAAYLEQQRLKGEDDARAREKADENYQRQLEDLGRNLADEEDLQELSAEEIKSVLERYYGAGGVSDLIMEGWHRRENTRILVTAALLEMLARQAETAAQGPLLPGGIPMPGQRVGSMDEGGVVVGPQTVHVGAGIVEAFTPLGRIGGGAMDLSWSGGPIPISGLERASPTDVSAIARDLASLITEKIRTRRRN